MLIRDGDSVNSTLGFFIFCQLQCWKAQVAAVLGSDSAAREGRVTA